MSANKRLSGLFLIAYILTGTLLMSSCVKDPTLPVLTTNEVIEITTNSATISGNVAEDGGAEITARGICWGTVTMPTLSDNFKPSGTGPGKFSCVLSELEPNTTYYVRAFAENRVGIAYGNEVTFKTGIAAPSVTTGQVTGVTNNSAICAGTVTYSGGAPVLEKGICWSQTPDPDLDDSHASVSAGTDTYTCTLTGLSSGSRYYARAYVKNEVGTGYGEQVVFNTKVTDIEGNMYGTVYIGNQVWMTENLRTTRLNDDTQIPNIIDNDEWISVSTSAYCWYNNDKTFKPTYGALYNWFTINSGKLCPAGWHVPSDTEFNSLEIALGMQADQSHVWGWRGTNHGFKMKNNTGWGENGNGNNSSGFSAIPGGYRFGADGTFVFQTTITYWWASTENDADRGWYRRLDSASDQVYRASTSKKGGKYVRCVKD